MVKIFVSYSHDDEAVAQSIVGYLHKAYDDVWYDEKLHTGDTWWERIVGKIENCSHFIFLMSNESLKSDYCRKELSFAREKGKSILPIKVRRSIDLNDDLKYLEALQICEMLGKVTIDSLSELYAAIIRKSGSRENQAALTDAHRQADMKVARTLWTVLSSEAMDYLLADCSICLPLPIELYGTTVVTFLDLREKPVYQMYNSRLQNALNEFEHCVTELNGLIGVAYELNTETQKLIYDKSNIEDTKIQLVDSVARFKKGRLQLSMIFRNELPEFIFPFL